MAITNGDTNGTHSPINKVLILGDNRLASSILSGLTSTPLDLHQITHAQSTATSTANLTTHKSDFSPASLTSLFTTTRPDVLFSTQSPGSSSFQREIIDTAISTNIPRFVAAEFGHGSSNPQIQERLPPYKEKAEVIEYLREKSSTGDIEWTAIACGCQPLDHALTSGNLGFDLKWQSATIPGTGTEVIAASSSAWVGRLAQSIITHWDSVKNQYIYAAGTLTTANAILHALQDQTGQKWEIGHVDVEDMVREGERRFERGFPDAGMFLMERSVVFDENLDASRVFVEKDAKALLGLESGEALEDVIRRVVHEWEHHGGGKADCGCE